MGDLTRAELRTEVNKNLGDVLSGLSPANSAAAVARLNAALNLAQGWIAREREFKELTLINEQLIVVIGNPSVDRRTLDLPANIRSIYSIVYKQDSRARAHKLEYVQQRAWDQLVPYGYDLLTGVVTHYTIWYDGNEKLNIEWYKVPDAPFTIEMRYSAYPNELSNETGKSEYIKKDDLIIARATATMFRSRGALEDAAMWDGEANRLLRAAVLDDMRKPDYQPRPRGASDANSNQINYWQDPFVKENP